MPVENQNSQHVGGVPTGPNANGARGYEGAFGLTPRANEQAELDYAIMYVTTIKKRFSDKPETYEAFRETLRTYQKERRGINDVAEQMSSLFADHPDLLRKFTYLLPAPVHEQARGRLNRAARDSEMREAKAAKESAQQHHHQGNMHYLTSPAHQMDGGGGCHHQNQPGQFMGGGHCRQVVDEQPESDADNAARATCARLKRDMASRRLHEANVSKLEVGVLSAMKKLYDHLHEGARPLAKRVLLQLSNPPDVSDTPRDEARPSAPLLRGIYDAAERVRDQVVDGLSGIVEREKKRGHDARMLLEWVLSKGEVALPKELMRSLKMTGDLDARTDEGEWRVTSTLIVLADHFPAWTQLLRSEEDVILRNLAHIRTVGNHCLERAERKQGEDVMAALLEKLEQALKGAIPRVSSMRVAIDAERAKSETARHHLEKALDECVKTLPTQGDTTAEHRPSASTSDDNQDMLKKIETRVCASLSSAATSTAPDQADVARALKSRNAAIERRRQSLSQELGIGNDRVVWEAKEEAEQMAKRSLVEANLVKAQAIGASVVVPVSTILNEQEAVKMATHSLEEATPLKEQEAEEMTKRSLVEAANLLELEAGVAAVVAAAETRVKNLEQERSQAGANVKVPRANAKSATGAATKAKGSVPESDSSWGDRGGDAGVQRAFAFGVRAVFDAARPKGESAPPRFSFLAPDASSKALPVTAAAAAAKEPEPAVWPQVAMPTVFSMGGAGNGGARGKGPSSSMRGIRSGGRGGKGPVSSMGGARNGGGSGKGPIAPARKPSGLAVGVGELSTVADDGIDDGVSRMQVSRVKPIPTAEVNVTKACDAQIVSTVEPVRPLQQRATLLGGCTATLGTRDHVDPPVDSVISPLGPPIARRGSPVAPVVAPIAPQGSARSVNQRRMKCVFGRRRVTNEADLDAMKARLDAKLDKSRRLAAQDKKIMDNESLEDLHPLSTLRQHGNGYGGNYGYDDEGADVEGKEDSVEEEAVNMEGDHQMKNVDGAGKEGFEEQESITSGKDDQRNIVHEDEQEGEKGNNDGHSAQGGAPPPLTGK